MTLEDKKRVFYNLYSSTQSLDTPEPRNPLEPYKAHLSSNRCKIQIFPNAYKNIIKSTYTLQLIPISYTLHRLVSVPEHGFSGGTIPPNVCAFSQCCFLLNVF